MNPKFLIVVPLLVVLSHGAVFAGSSTEEAGALVCVTDKWDEKELEKGHKIADAIMRCGVVPDDPSVPKYAQACTAKYEYLPDGSWKSAGECTNTYKNGDKSFETFAEGSHLKEYTYTKTGGTGEHKGLSGGGTYMYEPVSDTLFAGRFKGTRVLP